MASSGSINPLTKEARFSDLGISFTAHPVTGKPVVKKNADAITGALKNLIFTNRFERPYEPAFGSDILNRMFELFDPIEQVNMEEDIRLAIENYEPRVSVENITVVGGQDNNTLSVQITYYVINTAEIQELEVKVERIR